MTKKENAEFTVYKRYYDGGSEMIVKVSIYVNYRTKDYSIQSPNQEGVFFNQSSTAKGKAIASACVEAMRLVERELLTPPSKD